MRIAIIGLGVAGVTTAKLIRDKDKTSSINIFTDEPRLYYSRPKLIDYLAGTIKKEELFVYNEAWYREKKIGVRFERVTSLSAVECDKLIIANGSTSFIPPIKGSLLKGVFTLYSLDDADRIIAYAKDKKKVCVIGGGLLGLETARALRNRGLVVTVVEVFPRLLPRQLDEGGARCLKKEIEKLGIEVMLGAVVEGIKGSDKCEGVILKDGNVVACEMAIISAGTRPNLSLAKGAGLKTNKGIVVDDELKTSASNVYAVGDACEHRGRCYGIIPAALEQAKVVAENILKEGSAMYEGTIPSNALKVVGIDLVSMGEVNPEGVGFEEIVESDEAKGVYRKLIIKDNRLVGAILLGDKRGANEFMELIRSNKEVPEWRLLLKR